MSDEERFFQPPFPTLQYLAAVCYTGLALWTLSLCLLVHSLHKRASVAIEQRLFCGLLLVTTTTRSVMYFLASNSVNRLGFHVFNFVCFMSYTVTKCVFFLGAVRILHSALSRPPLLDSNQYDDDLLSEGSSMRVERIIQRALYFLAILWTLSIAAFLVVTYLHPLSFIPYVQIYIAIISFFAAILFLVVAFKLIRSPLWSLARRRSTLRSTSLLTLSILLGAYGLFFILRCTIDVLLATLQLSKSALTILSIDLGLEVFPSSLVLIVMSANLGAAWAKVASNRNGCVDDST